MTNHTAAIVMESLLTAASRLATTLEDVRPELAPAEFKRYSKFVGEILASIQLDLMAPIIREHPELDPDRE